MTRTSLRVGGAALAGTITLGIITQTSAIATHNAAQPLDDSVVAAALASLETIEVDPAAAAAPAALTAGVIVPTLTQLAIPDLGAIVSSAGFALRDVVLDADPDLADRDLQYELQRQEGDAWVTVATGTTTGIDESATIANQPAGTYRVTIPAQYGMAEFISEPLAHAPRQLAAGISFNRDTVTTSIDVNPDPAAETAYEFTLEKKAGDAWQGVSSHRTDNPAGGFSFTDLPSGTYRVIVPDQANAMGAVSNEVGVISAADKKAEEERKAAERAAAERRAAEQAAARAAAQRSASSGSTSSSSSSSSSSRPIVDAPSGGGSGIVGTALAQVGDRYVLGGNGPNAFDCSGLTSYAYRAAGKSIPRTAATQYYAAQKVSNPRPGDLVFFLNGAQHVGIYLGNGKMVHAANPSRGVEVTSISSGWYSRTFTGFGRF